MCKPSEAPSSPPSLTRASWSSPAELVNLAWGADETGKALEGLLPQLPRAFALPPALNACELRAGRRRGVLEGSSRALRLRAWLLVAALLVARCLVQTGTDPEEAKDLLRRVFGEEIEDMFETPQHIDEDNDVDGEKTSQQERSWMKAGSVYQNSYMTLWNENGVAISVTLRVETNNSFRLRVMHLNSRGGGSEGWMEVQGTFHVAKLPGVRGRLRLIPDAPKGRDQVVSTDESLMDRGTLFMYRFLKRLGTGAMLGAVQFEVDTSKDHILVTPSNRVVQALWQQPVALSVTTEAKIWTSR